MPRPYQATLQTADSQSRIPYWTSQVVTHRGCASGFGRMARKEKPSEWQVELAGEPDTRRAS